MLMNSPASMLVALVSAMPRKFCAIRRRRWNAGTDATGSSGVSPTTIGKPLIVIAADAAIIRPLRGLHLPESSDLRNLNARSDVESIADRVRYSLKNPAAVSPDLIDAVLLEAP